MKGITAIHQETSAIAREGNDIVASTGNQRGSFAEFRGDKGRLRGILSQNRTGPGQGRGAASEGVEELTSLPLHLR